MEMIPLHTNFCMQAQIHLKDEFLEVLASFGIEQMLNKKPVFTKETRKNCKFNAQGLKGAKRDHKYVIL